MEQAHGQVSKTAVSKKLRVLPSCADFRIRIIQYSGKLKNLHGGDDLIAIIAQIDGIAGIAENCRAAWLIGKCALGFQDSRQCPDPRRGLVKKRSAGIAAGYLKFISPAGLIKNCFNCIIISPSSVNKGGKRR